jgi:hypothetical protein
MRGRPLEPICRFMSPRVGWTFVAGGIILHSWIHCDRFDSSNVPPLVTPSPDTLSQLATTCIAANRPGDAIPLFRQHLMQGPATDGKYASFSLLLELTGSLNEAEEMARKAMALDNRSKARHQQLASVLMLLHNRRG